MKLTPAQRFFALVVRMQRERRLIEDSEGAVYLCNRTKAKSVTEQKVDDWIAKVEKIYDDKKLHKFWNDEPDKEDA